MEDLSCPFPAPRPSHTPALSAPCCPGFRGGVGGRSKGRAGDMARVCTLVQVTEILTAPHVPRRSRKPLVKGTQSTQKGDTNTAIHAGPEVFPASWLSSSDYLLLYFPIKVWLMEPGTMLPF